MHSRPAALAAAAAVAAMAALAGGAGDAWAQAPDYPFKRIGTTTDLQNAISTAADGSGVQLHEGTYDNLCNIVIDGAIILEPVPGADVNITGRSSFTVLHDNATIRGLTFVDIEEVDGGSCGAEPPYFTYDSDRDHRLKGAIVLAYHSADFPPTSAGHTQALQGVTVEDNVMTGGNVHGILFRPYDAASRVTYTDITIRNNALTDVGTASNPTQHGAIVADYFNSASGDAIAGGLANVRVTGNTVTNADDDSISMANADGVTISGNTVGQHRGDAIWLGPGSSGVVIEDNMILDDRSSGRGISMHYANSDVTVRGNTVTGQASHGIAVCDVGCASTSTGFVSGSIVLTENNVHGNRIDLQNSARGTLSAERNYLGGGAPSLLGGVDAVPWYADPGRGEASLVPHYEAAWDADVAMPDNTPGFDTEVRMHVPVGGEILWMEVSVDVVRESASFDPERDLYVALEGPAGTSRELELRNAANTLIRDGRVLIDDNDQLGPDDPDTTEDLTPMDYAPISAGGRDGHTLIYRTTPRASATSEYSSPFSDFLGEQARGTWVIKMRDGASGDTGRVTGYALSVASDHAQAPQGPVVVGDIQPQPAREREPASVVIPLSGVTDPARQGYGFMLTSGHEGTDAAISPDGLFTWTPGEQPMGPTFARTFAFDVIRGAGTAGEARGSGSVEYVVTKILNGPEWDVEPAEDGFLYASYLAVAGQPFRQPLPPIIQDINDDGSARGVGLTVAFVPIGFDVDGATREATWSPPAGHSSAGPDYGSNAVGAAVDVTDAADTSLTSRVVLEIHLYPEVPPLEFAQPAPERVGEGEHVERDLSEHVTGGLEYPADARNLLGSVPGGAVAYAISGLPTNFDDPQGAAIDPATGVFTWTPGEDHGGPTQKSHTFKITVARGADSIERNFEVQVEEVNIDPVFDADPSTPALDRYPNTFTVAVNQPFSYQFEATDRDEGDAAYTGRMYSLSQSALDSGFDVDGVGTVTLTPDTVAQYAAVIRVDNGGADNRTSHSFRVTAVADDGTLAFHPVGLQYADEGEAVEFTLPIVNADANAVYNVTRGPDTASAEGGTFSWTPGEEDGGQIRVFTVSVTNPDGETASRQFGVQVIEDNTIPRIEGSGFLETRYNFWPGGDNTYTYQLTGTDEDIPEQRLTFEIESTTPEGAPATIGPDNGTVTWAPASAGDTVSLAITVRDDSTYPDPRGGRSNALTKDLIAVALDGAFAVESTRTDVPDAREYAPLNFTVHTVGGNPDTATFTCDASRSDYAGVTATLHGRDACLVEWTPRGGDAGKSNQRLRIDVYNGTQGDPGVSRQTFSSTVVVAEGTPPAVAANQPPVLTGVRDLTATVGVLFDDLDAGAEDPDGPDADVVFGISWDSGPAGVGLPPAGADFDTATGALAWTPEAGQEGAYGVTISADDGVSEPATGTLTITVVPAQAPGPAPGQPVTIGPIADRAATVGVPVTVEPVISNPGGHSLTITMAGLDAIEGESFNDQTGALSWTPSAGDVGAHQFTLVVDYGSGTAEEPFSITVAAAPPAANITEGLTAQNITAVLAGAQAGDTVTFGAGTYDFDGPVSVPAGVTLAPHMGAAVTLMGGAHFLVDAPGVTITGLRFDGVTAPAAIRAAVTEGLTIRDNEFADSVSGVVVAGAAGPISYASAAANECAVGAATAECAAQTSEDARLAAGEASSTALVTGNSFSGMSGYTVANLAGGTVNAERNYHGGIPDAQGNPQPGRVFGGVAVEPWYTDETLTVPEAFGASVGGQLGLAVRGGGSCGVAIDSGRSVSFGSGATWGSTVERSVTLSATGEAVTGVAVVSTQWTGNGAAVPGAETWASVQGHQPKDTSGQGATFALESAAAQLPVSLQLRLAGGSYAGSMDQAISYLVSCS